MPSSGIEYITSKEGIVRAIIIVFGCVAFALIADSGYGGVVEWAMAAYIISWVFSLLSYFFIATTLASKMTCGVSYDAVDVCISVFSFFHCLLASIVLAMYTGSRSDERIAADVFGFLVSLLYAVEIYLLVGNAPGNLQYLTSKSGIVKSLIFIFGCTTFALLDAAGYQCSFYNDGCDSARTWAFAAFIYCWTLSAILLLVRITGLSGKISVFETVDLVWSVFSFINYLVASIVLACYLKCNNFGTYSCDRRLASDIFGFVTAILFLIDAFLLKGASSGVTPK